jgi:hypothetical protein
MRSAILPAKERSATVGVTKPLHARDDGVSLVREPDAGDLPVRFDEPGVETDYG